MLYMIMIDSCGTVQRIVDIVLLNKIFCVRMPFITKHSRDIIGEVN